MRLTPDKDHPDVALLKKAKVLIWREPEPGEIVWQRCEGFFQIGWSNGLLGPEFHIRRCQHNFPKIGPEVDLGEALAAFAKRLSDDE